MAKCLFVFAFAHFPENAILRCQKAIALIMYSVNVCNASRGYNNAYKRVKSFNTCINVNIMLKYKTIQPKHVIKRVVNSARKKSVKLCSLI